MSQWYTFRSCTARLQIPRIFREFNHFTSILGKYRYNCNFIINGLLYMSASNGNEEKKLNIILYIYVKYNTYNTCVIKKLVVSLYLNNNTSTVLTFGSNSMQPSKFTKRANFLSLISQTNLYLDYLVYLLYFLCSTQVFLIALLLFVEPYLRLDNNTIWIIQTKYLDIFCRWIH